MQITYQDKEFINQNENIPLVNKVTDDDMNEIKNVVNSNYTSILNTINHINEYITASPSSDATLSDTIVTKIPLNTSIGVGASLTLNDGEIVVGAGVSKVLVNGNILFTTGGVNSGSIRGIHIQLNGTTVHYCNIGSTNTYTGASVSPFLLNVQENDKITLCGFNSTTTGSIVTKANTFLTVKVVE